VRAIAINRLSAAIDSFIVFGFERREQLGLRDDIA